MHVVTFWTILTMERDSAIEIHDRFKIMSRKLSLSFRKKKLKLTKAKYVLKKSQNADIASSMPSFDPEAKNSHFQLKTFEHVL